MSEHDNHMPYLMEAMKVIARYNVHNIQYIDCIMNELRKHFYEAYIHSINVAALAASIAKQNNMKTDEVSQIYLCGLLHDVGKIKVSRTILEKKGELTPAEFEQIKRHSTEGYMMVLPYVSQEIADVTYFHHERLDGSGYPFGLKESEIPEKAKIIMIADSYEALTAERVYHHRMTASDALKELNKWNGKKYDSGYLQSLGEVVGQ